ncbi:MAG: hypothetical protein ABFD75_12085 [Smithella sp.]
MEHTKTPWNYNDPDGKIRNASGEVIATIWLWPESGTRDANAAFIVKACNCHDEFVAALKRFMEYGDVFAYTTGTVNPYEQAKAALAKVGE